MVEKPTEREVFWPERVVGEGVIRAGTRPRSLLTILSVGTNVEWNGYPSESIDGMIWMLWGEFGEGRDWGRGWEEGGEGCQKTSK